MNNRPSIHDRHPDLRLVPSRGITGSAVEPAGPGTDPRERRQYLRWPVFWSASLCADETREACLVLDFSPGGAKVRCPQALPDGAEVTLEFAGAGRFRGGIAWRSGNFLGVRFADTSLGAELATDAANAGARMAC